MSLPSVAQGAKRKIIDYKAVFTLPTRRINAFTTKYTKQYAYVASAARSIDSPNAALQRMFEDRWQARQEPLWWSVITRKSFENKRVVRSYVARRVKHAFVESLRKEGYAQNGSRIEGQGMPLVGTVQLFPERAIMKTNFKDLVSQTDLLVQEIIKSQNEPIKPGWRRAGSREHEKKSFGQRGGKGIKSPLEYPRRASRSIKL